MPLKVVRNDITKMNTEAIVNTAGETPEVGQGCDLAIHKAAGYDKLHGARLKIGNVRAGETFITPGFDLAAKYIIHAVSPYYIDGEFGEEEQLRKCYRNSFRIAIDYDIKSIAFPLIATGSYGFPRAYGLRVAIDEINSFLLENDMDIYLVVFDTLTTELAEKLHPQIEAFITHNDVCNIRELEYGDPHYNSVSHGNRLYDAYSERAFALDSRLVKQSAKLDKQETVENLDFWDDYELHKRVGHTTEPFGVYLLYLADREGITLTELENTAWISKHIVHNVRKKAQTYRPDKRTAFQFCVGLQLGLDETRDLLMRAGYAISSSSLEDRIWEFFIENEHYDIIDISDALEKYGLKPIIEF